MTEDRNYQALIDALFERPAEADETARLLSGVAGDEVEELAELAATLARIDPEVAEPGAEAFATMRRGVRRELEAVGRPRAVPAGNRWLPIAATIGALLIGLAAGRWTAAEPTPLLAVGEPAADATLTELLERAALASDGGDGSGFRYSNLRLEEVDPQTVAIRVDVASDVELVRPKGDALVNEILAASLVGDTSLDARLDAIRHAGSDPRVARALAAAALEDPSVPVRLKALERLIAERPSAPATQEVLLAVLAEDTSVAMRLRAVEALDDALVGSELIERLEGQPLEDNDAVLWQARRRLSRNQL